MGWFIWFYDVDQKYLFIFQGLGMIEEIESTGGSGAGYSSKPPTKQERPKTNRSKTARKR